MSKEWKETLLMPKTNFEMKANLKNKEHEFNKMWKEKRIYEKSLEKNKKNQRLFLHDGPPYANGSLHVGHAMNKILKDIIVRNGALNGKYVPFIFGWDTHGLPIENKMLSELNMSKDDLDKVELRKKAAEYANRQVDIQASQFDKMNLFANLNNRYLTLDKQFEVGQLKLFKKMIMSGIAYKGMKPVYWSPSSQSALAEAEVEYQDIVSPQVIISFKVSKGNEIINKEDNLLIMTTTPWTLIANSGVAVGKDIDYDIIENNNNRYVVASELTNSVMKLLKFEEFKVIKTIKGKELLRVEYKRPIRRNEVAPVVLGHHVTTDVGTGLVHLAPLFGEEDYIIGKNNNLDLIMHVDEKGNLNNEAKEYKDMFYLDASKNIGMFLESKKELLSLKFVKHSYPHDWRTHKPVIYRGTPQWFVSIKKIKKEIIDSLKDVNSNPEWAVDRMSKMINNRDEWTISRQRTWGVPLIIFYDNDDNPIIKEEIFDYVINLVSKYGTDIWWERTTDELLPKLYRNKGFTREMDIMDVWFDSGTTSITPQTRGNILDNINGKKEIYFEGTDQYRGWFNSSLIISVVFRKEAPYKQLLSHGFVLDGKQQKMSKSKGNIINPLEVIEKYGAEILRLWVANSEYTSDVSISENILKQNVEIYRRIRNSIRFMLGNLFDFDENKKVKLSGIHSMINEQIDNFIFKINKSYKNYKFQSVIKILNQLLLDLSSFYFDFNKDTLYVEKEDNLERRQVQTNIFKLVNFIIKIIAPILPVTAEDAYNHFNKKDKLESIMLETIQEKGNSSSKEQEKWKDFFDLKNEIYKLLELAKKEKIIKRNNEAFVIINTESKFLKNLDLEKMLMVAKVEFGQKNEVKVFESEKCQRCWNHFEKGTLKENICTRCLNVVS